MLNNFTKMSTSLVLCHQLVLKDDEDKPQATLPLDPRAMLHSRDSSSFPAPDRGPDLVKQEEVEVPLELPINTVQVTNQVDTAKFSTFQTEWVTSEDEESDGESEGDNGRGAEPSCREDLKTRSKDPAIGLFDAEDSEGETKEEKLKPKGNQPNDLKQDIYQFVFQDHMIKEEERELAMDQDKTKLVLGALKTNGFKIPGHNVSITKKNIDGSIPAKNSKELSEKTVTKERKRATFNGTVDKTRHQCSECNKCFQCEAHLQRHMLIHYGLKPFQCPVCDKAFRYKPSYKAHLNMHTEEKPLTCSLCDKGFTQSRDLKRHMLSHTDEKNFDCQECGGKFKHKHNLIRHISVIHKAEKPYPCPMCDKAFAQKHYFMTHMRTHSGEKPFSCQVCSRNFGAKGTLRTHMKVHRKARSQGAAGDASI